MHAHFLAHFRCMKIAGKNDLKIAPSIVFFSVNFDVASFFVRIYNRTGDVAHKLVESPAVSMLVIICIRAQALRRFLARLATASLTCLLSLRDNLHSSVRVAGHNQRLSCDT